MVPVVVVLLRLDPRFRAATVRLHTEGLMGSDSKRILCRITGAQEKTDDIANGK